MKSTFKDCYMYSIGSIIYKCCISPYRRLVAMVSWTPYQQRGRNNGSSLSCKLRPELLDHDLYLLQGAKADFARAYISNVCVAEELYRNGLGYSLITESKRVAEDWGKFFIIYSSFFCLSCSVVHQMLHYFYISELMHTYFYLFGSGSLEDELVELLVTSIIICLYKIIKYSLHLIWIESVKNVQE